MGAIFTTKSTRTIDICVMVGDKRHRVSFMPSVLFGVKGESLYSTADDAIVEALKNHKHFGVYFFLKSEDDPAPKKEESKTIEEELPNLDDAIRNETVVTKQMAIAFIQGTFGDTFSSPNMSVAEMKREAARRWNVLFVKWGN